jgi:hypothetical protein
LEGKKKKKNVPCGLTANGESSFLFNRFIS